MSKCIGVDIGGTTSTVCVGDSLGNVQILSDQFATRSHAGPQATVGDIADVIHRLLASHEISLKEVDQVTLASPGPATVDGVLLKSPNLIGDAWNRCPIRQLLQDKLQQSNGKVIVRYLGDGQAAALGEFAVRRGDVRFTAEIVEKFELQLGAAEGDLQSLFMIAVGTGFGGGEVRDAKVVRGRAGRAGHAGHLMLPEDAFRHPHDRQLVVGNSTSTVESAVSLTALAHQLAYRLTLDQWKEHSLHTIEGSNKERAKRLRELAAGGDALAMELFDDQAKALGIALLIIQYIGDYDLLVVGGGVCDLADDLREGYLRIAKESFFAHALDGFRDFDSIEFSHCRDQASVIGAYADALEGCELARRRQ